MRTVDKKAFDEKYDELILGSKFFEVDNYYVRERLRYFNSLKLLLARLDHVSDMSRLHVLEIGGGQIALLINALFGCKAVVADVSDKYEDSLLKQGCELRVCDLLYDDLPDRNHFDVVVMLEVVEHLPIPPHKILAKIKTWMKPGGLLFITTPNLYRLRNVIRLALGMRVFDHFFIPERGHSIGHPFEYSAEHLSWQISQGGFKDIEIAYKQLSLTGSTFRAKLARVLLAPLLLRYKFRDSLVVTALAA